MSDENKETDAGKPSDGVGKIPDPQEIRTRQDSLRDVVLPTTIIVVSLVAVVAAIDFIKPDCRYNGFFFLSFAILFGAAGTLFGGRIGILLNAPAVAAMQGGIKAVGGVGAAIAGWIIASLSFPPCTVNWSSQITINQIPMAQPRTSDDSPKYFVTASVIPLGASAAEWSRRPDVLLSQDNDYRGILQFRIADTGNRVIFRMFRREADNDARPAANKTPRVLYSFLGSCQLTIEPKAAVEPVKSVTVFTTKSPSISLQFRESYLETLQEKSDLSQQGAILDKCVEGYFTDGSGRAERAFENPLVFKIGRSVFGNEEVTLSFAKQVVRPEALENPAVLKDATVKSAKDEGTVSGAGKTEVIGIPGSTPNPAQKAPSREEQTAVPPTENDQLQQTANCVKDEVRKALVLSYLAGSDLDQTQRFDIYKNWDQISCLVLAALANEGGKFNSRNQGRALRLLASTIINNSGDANTTYWQPNSGKRDLSLSLPKYLHSKYIRLIVNLVGVDDDYVRAEAVRFIKLLPNNQVEAQFQEKLQQMADTKANSGRQFFAIGAAALYYNRIVEWLSVPDSQKANLRSTAINDVAREFAAGQAWMRDEFFQGRSAKPFLAMLLYAKAIVEREMTLRDDRGKASFNQMLSVLRSTSDPYPSRSQHIGQALILSSSLSEGSAQQRNALRSVQAATEFDLVRTMDGKDPFASKLYAISLAPDMPQTDAQVAPGDNARVLLQSADWYLVSGKGKIGWIKSPKT